MTEESQAAEGSQNASAPVSEKPAAQTVAAEPLDLTREMAAGVEPSVSAPAVSQGASEKPEPQPPWQKTADEIDQVEAEAAGQALLSVRAASAGHLLGLLERIGPTAAELQQILAGVDTGKLKSLLDAAKNLFAVPGPVGSPQWIKDASAAALKVLRVWSALRPGDPDHALLDKLDRLLSAGGPALDAFVSLVGGLLAHQPTARAITAQHIGDVATNAHTEAFKAAAINWTLIQSIAQAVFQILQLIKNAKSPAAPAPAGG